MREIRFRIYDTKRKEWIHGPGDEINLFGEVIIFGEILRRPDDTAVSLDDLNDLVALQYTGLKDKNGVDIYEGDVVLKCDPPYWRNHDEEPDAEDLAFYRGGTAQVVATKYGWQMDEIDCGEWCFNGPDGREWNEYDIEVIGNIYENPELLKQ